VDGNEIDEIRAQRFAFLLAVYRVADGDTMQYMNWESARSFPTSERS
jgi:hypothetical protein